MDVFGRDAMKLHAVQDRNDDRKRASDAWDLFRRRGCSADEGSAEGTALSELRFLSEMFTSAAAVRRARGDVPAEMGRRGSCR